MSKRVKKKESPEKRNKKGASSVTDICDWHDLTSSEVSGIQENLLKWYDSNQRVLPWRDIAKKETDPDKRGYAVWVSEIMLQQTQVATVISYFNKWIEKWPTVSDLASATLEDVNKVWAGLGYYSRARRLHEGSKIIVNELDGSIPQTVDKLMNRIPGIGLYSASAIASVAFQKPVGVVDGNVIRVLSRLRIIGVPVTYSGVRDHLWKIANTVVSPERPGDFNQALMELGAVICTPQNPKCSDCPINSFCRAYIMSQKSLNTGNLDIFFKKSSSAKSNAVQKYDNLPDIENANKCSFCIKPSVWKENPQVTVFPCKIEKKSARSEKIAVVVVEKNNCFLMTKRPEKGLFAGLWEFPNVIIDNNLSEEENSSALDSMLKDVGVSPAAEAERKFVGNVVHMLSHITITFVIEYLEVTNSCDMKKIPKEVSWLTEEEIKSSAVSTAMKKVLNAVQNKVKKNSDTSSGIPSKKRRRIASDSKQKSIKSFFT